MGKGVLIKFENVNNHRLHEFKTCLGNMIMKEIRSKKISTNDLQRQMKALGYHYPIIRVIKNSMPNNYPFELYGILLVLVGVDIYLIPNEEQDFSKKYIKNRKRL